MKVRSPAKHVKVISVGNAEEWDEPYVQRCKEKAIMLRLYVCDFYVDDIKALEV